jgi:hypothetical protein
MAGVAVRAESQTEIHPRSAGTLVDLEELRARLEQRLEHGERELSAVRNSGNASATGEVEWVRTLRRYERLCDLLARKRDAAA